MLPVVVSPNRFDGTPRDDRRGGIGPFAVEYWPVPYVLSLCESSCDGTPGCVPSAARFEAVRLGSPAEGSPRIRYELCLDTFAPEEPLTGNWV